MDLARTYRSCQIRSRGGRIRSADFRSGGGGRVRGNPTSRLQIRPCAYRSDRVGPREGRIRPCAYRSGMAPSDLGEAAVCEGCVDLRRGSSNWIRPQPSQLEKPPHTIDIHPPIHVASTTLLLYTPLPSSLYHCRAGGMLGGYREGTSISSKHTPLSVVKSLGARLWCSSWGTCTVRRWARCRRRYMCALTSVAAMVVGAYKGPSDPNETGYIRPRVGQICLCVHRFCAGVVRPSQGGHTESLLIGAVWTLVPAFSLAKAVLLRWHELVTQVLAMGLPVIFP